MKKTVIGLALFGLLQGCGNGEAPSAESQAYAIPDWEIPDPGLGRIEFWKLELMKQDRLFDSAISTRPLAEWAEFFTEEGVMVFPETGENQGSAAIQGSIFEAAEGGRLTKLRWAPERAEVSMGGDLGFTVGTYWSTGQDEGGSEVGVSGRYVSIWRIQGDGTWKVEMSLGVPLTDPEPISAEGSYGIIGGS